MISVHTLSIRKTLVSFALIGLLAAACSPATKPTAQPTSKPAVAAKPTALSQPTTASATKATPVPTAKPTPTVQPQPTTSTLIKMPPIGQAQTLGDLSILPTKVETMTEFADSKPDNGSVYLVVSLIIENKGKTGELAFDPAMLSVAEALGRASFPVVKFTMPNMGLEAQKIKAGAKIEGDVVFEVPQKPAERFLQLDNKAAGQYLTWSLAG